MERGAVWQVVRNRAVELLDVRAVAEDVDFAALGVDSLALLEFTLKLEDDFDVELPEEEVLAVHSFAGLVDVVLAKLRV